MSEEKYLDVKEFALLVGRSYQSIYKAIDKGKLDAFLSKKDGKTVINARAEALYHSTNSHNSTTRSESEHPREMVERTEEQRQVDNIQKLRNTVIEKQKEIDKLEKELSEAKESVKKKEEQIYKLTDKILEYTNKFAELSQSSQFFLAKEYERKEKEEQSRIEDKPQIVIRSADDNQGEEKKEVKRGIFGTIIEKFRPRKH